MTYAIALSCDLDRRLTSVSMLGIRFNIGKLGFMLFESVWHALLFIEKWKKLTTWNWASYEVVVVDEKYKSHRIKNCIECHGDFEEGVCLGTKEACDGKFIAG